MTDESRRIYCLGVRDAEMGRPALVKTLPTTELRGMYAAGFSQVVAENSGLTHAQRLGVIDSILETA